MPAAEQARLWVGHAANLALAMRPGFVIMAVPRSGTTYAARYLTQIGVRCSHEGYFTPEGPKLLNRDRRFGSVGDASWMSVPFAPRMRLKRLHQTRHPWAVISSLYRLGLFDPRLRQIYGRYRDFIDDHFQVGDCPIDSCLRFYLEWNGRCEDEAELRYRVEDFEAAVPRILAVIGAAAARPRGNVAKDTNSRKSAIGDDWQGRLSEGLRNHARFGELEAMAVRYGYDSWVEAPWAAEARPRNV